jgi:hypothetical protein
VTRMNCPSCDLTVSFGRGEGTAGELCPRCLARSSGTMSVRLNPGAVPKPLGTEGRIRELLRKRGLRRSRPA